MFQLSHLSFIALLIFRVTAGNRKVKLVCPKGAKPGQSLAITLPKEQQNEKALDNGPNGPNVKLIPDTDPPGTNVYQLSLQKYVAFYYHHLFSLPNSIFVAYLVTIPQNIRGGQKFPTLVNTNK